MVSLPCYLALFIFDTCSLLVETVMMFSSCNPKHLRPQPGGGRLDGLALCFPVRGFLGIVGPSAQDRRRRECDFSMLFPLRTSTKPSLFPSFFS